MRKEPEGFEEFWQYWMKRKRDNDARGKCRPAYVKQVKDGATPEDILLAAHCYFRKLKDPAFTQLAATWLNGEGWVDEAPAQRAWLADQAAPRPSNVVPIPVPKSKFSADYDRKRMESQ